ncbi:MAG: helix-turn-helix domain-containing protein [Bacilli bacterium]|jgi:antitoxin component HigA of HigAB toxin-antitoxin module
MNKNIRAQMLFKNMTNQDLAKLLGISTVSVSFKLNKKRDFTQTELDKMANHFGVSVDYLLERSKT